MTRAMVTKKWKASSTVPPPRLTSTHEADSSPMVARAERQRRPPQEIVARAAEAATITTPEASSSPSPTSRASRPRAGTCSHRMSRMARWRLRQTSSGSERPWGRVPRTRLSNCTATRTFLLARRRQARRSLRRRGAALTRSLLQLPYANVPGRRGRTGTQPAIGTVREISLDFSPATSGAERDPENGIGSEIPEHREFGERPVRAGRHMSGRQERERQDRLPGSPVPGQPVRRAGPGVRRAARLPAPPAGPGPGPDRRHRPRPGHLRARGRRPGGGRPPGRGRGARRQGGHRPVTPGGRRGRATRPRGPAEEDLQPEERTALALLRLAGVAAEEFTETDYEVRRAALESAATTVSEEVFRYWSQNPALTVEL